MLTCLSEKSSSQESRNIQYRVSETLLTNGIDSKIAANTESDSQLGTDNNVAESLRKLQMENANLKILLEKLDTHTQEQDSEIEKLKQQQEKFEDSKFENEELRNRLKTFALSSGNSLDDIDDLRKVNTDLQSDNNALMERLVTLEEELQDMKMEKESLVQTLQLMQDELMVSEQVRQRKNTGSSEG